MIKYRNTLLSIIFLFVFSACAMPTDSTRVSSGQVGEVTEYQEFLGTVTKVTSVFIEGSGGGSAVGAVAGGVAGGVLGNLIGGGAGNTVATVAGVLGGSMVGSAVGDGIDGEHAIELLIRVDDGRIFSVFESVDKEFFVGQRVSLLLGETTKVEPYTSN